MATRLAKFIRTSVHSRSVAFVTGALLALGSVSLPAQPPESTADGDIPQGVYVETVEVHWVLVPAVVRGPSGYIKDLRQSDFRLTVDGRPVEIESFEAGEEATY